MATIRDVARYANVSVGTVSNVLNGSPLVKDETRKRVTEAIEALSFHPAAAARSLSTKRTNTIGMVRTELRPYNTKIEFDPVVLDLISGVTTEAIDSGVGLTFWTIPVGAQETALYRRLVSARQVDGLIRFAPREHDPRITYLMERGFPFVVFGRNSSQRDFHWIDVDGAYGIRLAVDHLFELGHRRIGYVGPPSEQSLAEQRWLGFTQGMSAHGLAIDGELIFEGDFTERSGQLGAHHLLEQPQPPTAILCNNDRMAFGAMREVQSRGKVVGRDVAIIGFDDIPLARYTHPALTTIQQPVQEIGSLLFRLLQAVIEGEPTEEWSGRLIKPTLQVRQSTLA
ncbi:MAG: LacI family DNA-binding transcriptional regulator [Anaerolineae bacterium]|nr:LacI family DNA-binding transcriptional regulator [Anaerolineae bacterium]